MQTRTHLKTTTNTYANSMVRTIRSMHHVPRALFMPGVPTILSIPFFPEHRVEHVAPQSETRKIDIKKAPALTDNTAWSYSDFRRAVEYDDVVSVKISNEDNMLMAVARDGSTGVVKLPNQDDPEKGRLVDELMLHNVTVRFKGGSPSSIGVLIHFVVAWVLPLSVTMLGIMLLVRMTRNPSSSGLFGNKSPGNFQETPDTGVTFDQVAGCDSAKAELVEVVDFLKNPGTFAKFGVRTPNCLLVGEPGVGKTLLAKAVAHEAKVPFFSVCGSDFVHLFVGMGAKNVRELFAEARKKGKCLVFIDEIDAIAKSRGGPNSFNGGNDEREQTINQLLSEMDGFDSAKGIVVIGATNRMDVLDPAILRSGRFDRKVVVESPDFTGRVAIFNVHIAKRPVSPEVDFESLARATAGVTGADIENICNESAIFAMRKKKNQIEQADFEDAIDKMQMGSEKRSLIISPTQRRLVAVHESSHTIVALHVGDFDVLKKVSIIARQNGSGGVTMFEPTPDRVDLHMYTKEYLENELCVALAGRIGEEMVFGESQATTGASSDLQRATSVARQMVTRFGFSNKLGTVAWATHEHGGPGYSEQTGRDIDDEIFDLIAHAKHRAHSILTEHSNQLTTLANALIDREVMSGSEIRELLGLTQKSIRT